MKKFVKDEQQQEEQDYAVALEMASIHEMPVQWLWPGRIVMENLTLLVGEPGAGKSALAIDIAARVTRGAAWPDGTPGAEPKSVLMISAQDHAFFSMRPALAAAGADMNKIATAYDARDANDRGGFRRPLDLPKDFNKLRKLIRDRGDCKLVVIDPIMAFVRGGASLRNTLMTLVMMAGDLHVAILAVTHLRPGGLRAMYRTEGGSALTSAARGLWLAVEEPEIGGRKSEVGGELSVAGCQLSDFGKLSPGEVGGQQTEVVGKRRLLLPVKNNLVEEMAGLAYRLRPAKGRQVTKVEWEGKGVLQTADEALAREGKPKGRKLSVLEQAMEFLQEALADGPQQVKVIELAAEALHGIKRRTLVRARKALGIKHYRAKASGQVWMRLPSVKEIEEKTRKNSGTVGPQAENPGNHGTLSQEACVPSGTQAEVIGTQGNGEEELSVAGCQLSETTGEESDFDELSPEEDGEQPSAGSTGSASSPQGSGGGMQAFGGLSPREWDNEKRKKQYKIARRAQRDRRSDDD